MFDEDITVHLQSKWTFLKHLLGAIRIDRYFWNSNRRCVAKDVVSKDFIRKYWYGIAIALEEYFSLTINTFSHGYHEYMSVWMPHISEESLFCRRELSNEYDEYAAAIVAIDHFKREKVVGHVPLFLSKTLNKFLRLPGSYASCKVTGTRINREIGVGLEIPIEITFVGKETTTEWLKKALDHINRMNEEKVLKCKKWTIFIRNQSFFVIQPFLFHFPLKNGSGRLT